MLMKRRSVIIYLGLLVGLLGANNTYAQCDIIVDTANITQVTCPGGSDGFANLTQTPYINYSWDNLTNGQNYGSGPTITSVSTLAAGLYVVVGTQSLSGSCPATMVSDTFEILEPIVNNSLNPPLVCDSTNCNVTSTININQQFPGYTYGVSVNGGASQTLPAVTSNLCAGNQTYTVNYNDGTSTTNCPTETFNITGSSLSASINLTDTIVCFGDYATIQVITLGGAFWNTQFLYLLEYNIFGNWYQLSTQTTYDTATFTLLPANNYRVTVTDTSGICTAQAFITITQPPDIMATFSITNPSLCFGDSIADLHLNVFGGTPPYTVTLNGGPSMPITANNIDFLNVPAGSYQVIITDANGCTKIRNQTITPGNGVCGCTDSLALNFNATATVDDSTCYYCSITTNVTQWLPTTVSACDGFINVTTSGTAPYAYSWSNGNTTALNLNLCDGAYTYTVIDSNGCGFTETIILTTHLGCTDSTAMNYNPTAIVDDGSCIAFVYGCTDSTATNYNPLANTDDGSCIPHIYGCTDSTATNYNPSANTDDGSCTYCYATADIASDSITACDSASISTNLITNGSYCWSILLTCNYTIELWDGVGDGWNAGGNPAQYHNLEVHVNGILYNTYTMLSGFGPDIYYIQVNDGDILETFPQNNGANYADCGYVIKSSQGLIVRLDGLPPVLGNPMLGCNTNLNSHPEVNVFIPNILTYSFSWQTLNGSITGLSNPNIYNPSVTVNFFTDYIVTAYDSAYSWCSVFDTITVFPNNTSVQLQQTISICDDDSLWIGSNYHTITGNYIDTLTATNGCDSIVYTNLTVKNNTASYDTLSVNVSIVWNGMTLTFSGDYSFTLINSVGCDSIVNLNLTINPSGILIIMNREKTLLKVTDVLGREIPYQERTPLFYIYDDGTVEKRITIE